MRRLSAFLAAIVLALQVGAVATAVPVAAESGPCVGDGTSGKRIHLWYAWETADRYSTDVVKIRRIVALADARLAAIGGQHYRFLCSQGQIVIDKVHVRSPDMDAFKDAIRAMGHTSRDRIYNAFEPEARTRGSGDVTNDDRADPATNAANAGPRYSAQPIAVDSFMHETGHNLGAVQNSAPHASGSWHCWDAQDMLCYNDGGSYFRNGGELRTVCGDGLVDNAKRWDCNLDDYYNPHPAPGSYLATHWNIRDSYFLTAVPTPPPAPANLHVVANSPSSITMAWNGVFDADGISTYALEIRRVGVGTFTTACETTASSCTEAGLPLLLGSTFEFRVRAQDGAGTWGAYSDVVRGSCSTPVCL